MVGLWVEIFLSSAINTASVLRIITVGLDEEPRLLFIPTASSDSE